MQIESMARILLQFVNVSGGLKNGVRVMRKITTKIINKGLVFSFIIVQAMMNLSTAQASIVTTASVDFGGASLPGCVAVGSGSSSVGPCSKAGKTLVGSAESNASFGAGDISLGASATVSGFTNGINDGLASSGVARIFDTVVIQPTDNSLLGQAGFGLLEFELSGDLNAAGDILGTTDPRRARANAVLGFLVSVGGTRVLTFSQTVDTVDSLNFSTSIPTSTYDFIYGDLLDITMTLIATTEILGVIGTFDLSSNFINTVVLQSIVVTDEFGNNVQAALATSDGEVLLETNNGQIPTVPEPATLLLMGMGLVGLGFTRWRRLHA